MFFWFIYHFYQIRHRDDFLLYLLVNSCEFCTNVLKQMWKWGGILWLNYLPCRDLERRPSRDVAPWCPDFSAAQCWWSCGRGCRSIRHAKSSSSYGCDLQILAQKAWWCSTTSPPAAHSVETQECTPGDCRETQVLYREKLFPTVWYFFAVVSHLQSPI